MTVTRDTVPLDADQAHAWRVLGRLERDLAERWPHRPRWAARRRWTLRRPLGVYLWGRPGRGKTWLMDRFLERQAGVPSWRVHVHEFLSSSHVPPGIRLLCFDEFHVHDVGDALFLRRLLRQTAERDITVVATSNYEPERLLPNPLHHHHVLPAVAAIRGSMEVVKVDGSVDYRQQMAGRGGFGAGRIVSPGSVRSMAAALGAPPPSDEEGRVLRVHGRDLPALAVRGAEAWFGFDDLCVRPVSVDDYLVLTQELTSWVVTGVPHFDATTTEAPQRLASLVDVLHDRDLPLQLGCDVGIAELTRATRQPLDPGRMYSRLRLLS